MKKQGEILKTKNRASSRLWVKNRVSQKIRASSRLLAKNRVSQVFWEPIENRVSLRSVLLEAVYLEALLYLIYKFNGLIYSQDNQKLALALVHKHYYTGVVTVYI